MQMTPPSQSFENFPYNFILSSIVKENLNTEFNLSNTEKSKVNLYKKSLLKILMYTCAFALYGYQCSHGAVDS